MALVDVAALYDGWSGGQVAPEAIRDFVRWAAVNTITCVSTTPTLSWMECAL
ncbi:MAG: hypothetical protein HY328_12650 [Chloroflexi bacterium]|nr:hypothetical protein [Chloroflexota bacterium]